MAVLLAGEVFPSVWPALVVVAMAYRVFVATALAYVLWYPAAGAGQRHRVVVGGAGGARGGCAGRHGACG